MDGRPAFHITALRFASPERSGGWAKLQATFVALRKR